MNLRADEKKTLLRLARYTLENITSGQKEPMVPSSGFEITEILKKPAGVFVTLEKNRELRGCIGYMEAIQPLYMAVMENTISAATKDIRFPAVESEELGQIAIKISVLTPKEEISTSEAFIPGKHGILMEAEGRRAVFLPQVASEQRWDRETTLRNLCLKAGLPPDAWKKGAKFWVFESMAFGETNDSQ
ncbi:MAG: AmmeMemoRadiSam system protein A [bacterium]|nr:AmmeMemoRadiSam system protein A [bacterium]